MITLWITGQIIKADTMNTWELSGIFDSEDKAVEACRDLSYFIVPVELNKQAPHETTEFPKVRFPLGESYD